MKKIKARISQLHGTTEYWNNKIGFIPKQGEIIIYDDYKSETDQDDNIIYIPGIKIGTGNAYVQDLPFIGEEETKTLLDHINNTAIHVGVNDRLNWDSKLDVEGVIGEELIFTNE